MLQHPVFDYDLIRHLLTSLANEPGRYVLREQLCADGCDQKMIDGYLLLLEDANYVKFRDMDVRICWEGCLWLEKYS